MKSIYLLSCEHGGNEIPQEFSYLFKGNEEILYSHQAIDFGALRLAYTISEESKSSLYKTTISRLLIECNRSLDNDELFSRFSKKASEKEKGLILENYYYPHRNGVENAIKEELSNGNNVIHISVHTFTPVIDKEVRDVEVGILFDPLRPGEKRFYNEIQESISTTNPSIIIKENSPYAGTEDGFTTYLRKKFSAESYSGIELEVNQKFFLNGEPQVWQKITGLLSKTIAAISRKLSGH